MWGKFVQEKYILKIGTGNACIVTQTDLRLVSAVTRLSEQVLGRPGSATADVTVQRHPASLYEDAHAARWQPCPECWPAPISPEPGGD